ALRAPVPNGSPRAAARAVSIPSRRHRLQGGTTPAVPGDRKATGPASVTSWGRGERTMKHAFSTLPILLRMVACGDTAPMDGTATAGGAAPVGGGGAGAAGGAEEGGGGAEPVEPRIEGCKRAIALEEYAPDTYFAQNSLSELRAGQLVHDRRARRTGRQD